MLQLHCTGKFGHALVAVAVTGCRALVANTVSYDMQMLLLGVFMRDHYILFIFKIELPGQLLRDIDFILYALFSRILVREADGGMKHRLTDVRVQFANFNKLPYQLLLGPKALI